MTDLRDARVLAEFANLEPARVDYFRNNFPGFVPDGWWTVLDWREGDEGPLRHRWQHVQDVLRSAWQKKFPRETMIRLVSAPTQIMDRMLEAQAAGDAEFKARDILTQDVKVWPYQNAVAFLAAQPWRALFCASCGKRFAADKPGRKFCSDACTANARKASKLASWHEHKDEWQVRSKAKKPRKGKKA